MQSGSQKQDDVARLKADVCAAGIEVLSAHCAADRIRLQYSLEDVVTFGERHTLKKAIASSQAIYRYFALIELHLKHTEDSDR
jgi:hypothetical protein